MEAGCKNKREDLIRRQRSKRNVTPKQGAILYCSAWSAQTQTQMLHCIPSWWKRGWTRNAFLLLAIRGHNSWNAVIYCLKFLILFVVTTNLSNYWAGCYSKSSFFLYCIGNKDWVMFGTWRTALFLNHSTIAQKVKSDVVLEEWIQQNICNGSCPHNNLCHMHTLTYQLYRVDGKCWFLSGGALDLRWHILMPLTWKYFEFGKALFWYGGF